MIGKPINSFAASASPIFRCFGAVTLALSTLVAGAQTPADETAAGQSKQVATTNDGLAKFGKLLAAAPLTIIADTNHKQQLHEIVGSDAFLDALQATGKKFVVIEDEVYAQGAVDQLAAGKITTPEFVELRLAQMAARHETYAYTDDRSELRIQGALIVNAAKRGIHVIYFDALEGTIGPVKAFNKQVLKDFSAYRKAGGKEEIDDFVNEREQKAKEKLFDTIRVNRMSDGVNADMLSNMTLAMKSERKQEIAGIDPRRHGQNFQGTAIFVGANHVPALTEVSERRGIPSQSVLLFPDQTSVENYDAVEAATAKNLSVKSNLSKDNNYIVVDGNLWHTKARVAAGPTVTAKAPNSKP